MRKFLLFVICCVMALSGCEKTEISDESNSFQNIQSEQVETVEDSKFVEFENVDVTEIDVEEEKKATKTSEKTVEKEPEIKTAEENQEEQVIEETPSPVQEKNQSDSLEGKVIVIDAGHGITSYGKKEAIAPNSNETKPANASGTKGKNQTEEELNLAVALKLRDSLESMGAQVHMTRTEHESSMTNIDRAEFANNLNADISVKIHADGVNSSGAHGVSVLVPGNKYIKDSKLIKESESAAENIIDNFVKSTGAKNRGVITRNDMTGFNWSSVPVVLVELGFMTNPDEDAKMETEDYQNKMVSGIAAGLENYFQSK